MASENEINFIIVTISFVTTNHLFILVFVQILFRAVSNPAGESSEKLRTSARYSNWLMKILENFVDFIYCTE